MKTINLPRIVFALIFTALSISCFQDFDYHEFKTTTTKRNTELPEDVLMQVSFKSKTTTYTKLADEADRNGLDEDAKHFVLAAAVPTVRKDKQLFRIYKNGTYSLIIDIETPEFNPARQAFRNEFKRNDWELGRIIINSETITAYDMVGGVIFSDDNSHNPFFNRLIDKVISDDEFASSVNIGNALFTVSGGAENYTDSKLKSFFISPNATISSQDGFVIIEENTEDKMRFWGSHTTSNDDSNYRSVTSNSVKFSANATQEHSLDETQKMINDTITKWNSGKNPNDIHVYKAIDTVSNTLAAEVTYAGQEQVLGLTFFEVNDDEQKTLKTCYTEDYETSPVYDLDMINVESIEYSDVQIINTKNNNNGN